MTPTFSIKIVGPAGTGVKSFGELLLKSLFAENYQVFGYTEYPSLVRGGHNTYQITIRQDNLNLSSSSLDLLIPLTETALETETNNLTKQSLVIGNENISSENLKFKLIKPKLIAITSRLGNPLLLNTVYFGFLSYQFQIPQILAEKNLIESLNHKAGNLQELNLRAFRLGFQLSQKFKLHFPLPKTNKNRHRLSLTGNEAVGLGAISAGLDLYSAYPMTPSSSLLHFLVKQQNNFPHQTYQSEDEISTINVALGASFAGALSMTGTSGGGFALMQESVSLAGMLELPLVIFLAMRPGPATGMSTWTSQGDLLFAVNAGHGEFPKVVLAPGDGEEAFEMTRQAFALSQEYQLPVIILSDKYLAESRFSFQANTHYSPVKISRTKVKKSSSLFYPRYQAVKGNSMPLTFPGQAGGEYNANSSEHDVYGFASTSVSDRLLQTSRRLQKIALLKQKLPLPQLPSPKTDTALISWGSTKDIAAAIAAEIPEVTPLNFNYLWPLPQKTGEFLQNFKKIIVLENNLTHQFARLLQGEGCRVDLYLGADTGRPLNPLDYLTQIKKYVR